MTEPTDAQQAATSMEVDRPTPESSVSRKRTTDDPTVIVDPDETTIVIGSSKKPRIEVNEPLKIKCIGALVDSYIGLFLALKVPNKEFLNLDVSSQITNILFAAYSVLRQEANNSGEEIRKKAERSGFTVNVKGKKYDISLAAARKVVEESFKAKELTFKKFAKDDKTNWTGTVGPYLNFFCGFGLRWKELRLGHAQMSIGKEEGKSKTFLVESYGLHGGQHILLEGCTFPPEKRSSMVQSLGPMTILLCYIRSQGKYKDKWLAAAKRTFAFIPDVDYLLSELHGKSAHEIRHIIGVLGDICRIATTRQATRAFFPICLVAYVASDTASWDKLKLVRQSKMFTGGSEVTVGPDILKMLNFSGKGAFLFWDLFQNINCRMNGEWTQAEAAQVAYHCTFGTFKEDLGVLSEITNCGNWFTREELGAKFKKHNTSGKVVEFPLITQLMWSKLTSACQTSLLSGTYFQDSSLPCFSGSRVANFGKDFFENIAKKIGRSSGGRTLQQLTASLSDLLDKLLTKVRDSGNRLEMGTTSWFVLRDTTVNDLPTETPFVVQTKGLHFLGRK